MVVERRLLGHPHVEGLVHDQEAHAVGELQQLGRRRIVASAQGVGAHLREQLELALERAEVERRAERAQVVVVAHPLQLELLAVQEEAAVGVEAQRANSEARLVGVDERASSLHGSERDVAIRTLLGAGAPELRIGKGRTLLGAGARARRHLQFHRRERGHGQVAADAVRVQLEQDRRDADRSIR